VQNEFIKSRITLLDVLRGYALMGLFLIHMVEYYEVYWRQPEPGWVNTGTFFMFGGKAYAMFALLFGVSFFIIMNNQAKKGLDFRGRFLWRVILLLGLGYIHGLVYGGDILQLLAVTGMLLVPLYYLSNTVLLLAALFFILQIPSLILFILVNTISGFDYSQALHWSAQPPVFEVYANGSFPEVLRTNMWQGQIAKWLFMLESGRVWNIVGLSILGFLLGRVEFFVDTSRYRTVYIRTLIAALVAAIFISLFREKALALASATSANWMFGNIYNAWYNHALIAITFIGLILLYQLPVTGRVLQLLAPCGRVTLTYYVMQSVIFVPFFYGYGAGAHAYIGQPLSLALGLIAWCLQIWLAHYWIQQYHYGPFEWAWRSATWMRTDIPFKRVAMPAS
jgi:uncharacterized protein